MNNSSNTQYLFIVIVAPFLFLVSIASINFHLDPYQIFSAGSDNEYATKPALHANLRLHKTYQIQIKKPDTLILGTSKAIQGIPTNHSHFKNRNVYNAGLPLATAYEYYRLLQHTVASGDVKELIFSPDFLSYNALARTDGGAAGFVEERLKKNGAKNPPYIQDYISSLISFDVLKASIKQIATKKERHHKVINAYGGRPDSDMFEHLSDGGHRSSTRSIESFVLNTVYLAAPYRKFSFRNKENNSLHWFMKTLELAYQHDIKTNIVISPSHARLWELIYAAGLWPQLEQWKQAMVDINTSLGLKHNKPEFKIWDFTAANRITREEFPDLGDVKSKMKYYYEAVHYSQKTGGLMLDKITDNNDSKQVAANFGILLTQSTISNTLNELRQLQRDFRQDFPQDVSNINTTANEILGNITPVAVK